MKHFETTLYPSANRFVLIDDVMVPFKFLEKLHDEVFEFSFRQDGPSYLIVHGCSDFYLSLSDYEISFFGLCIRYLIKNGLQRNFYRDLKLESDWLY